jgi:hypothetical protein
MSNDTNIIEKKVDKAKRKVKIRKDVKVLIISLLVIIVICIATFVTYKQYQELNEFDIKNYELYQYFGGQKFEYTGELTLKRNGDITELKYRDIKIEVDSTPIYFSKIENDMLLPTNMALLIPRMMTKNYKLPYFSRITMEETETDSNAFLVNENDKTYLEKSFLYDGADLYVFLYETTIKIDNKTIKLSPLSYISVIYEGEINYYDKKNDKFVTIDTSKDDVIATLDSYKINLSTDMIMYETSNKLLIKNVDNLKTFTK